MCRWWASYKARRPSSSRVREINAVVKFCWISSSYSHSHSLPARWQVLQNGLSASHFYASLEYQCGTAAINAYLLLAPAARVVSAHRDCGASYLLTDTVGTLHLWGASWCLVGSATCRCMYSSKVSWPANMGRILVWHHHSAVNVHLKSEDRRPN